MIAESEPLLSPEEEELATRVAALLHAAYPQGFAHIPIDEVAEKALALKKQIKVEMRGVSPLSVLRNVEVPRHLPSSSPKP